MIKNRKTTTIQIKLHVVIASPQNLKEINNMSRIVNQILQIKSDFQN